MLKKESWDPEDGISYEKWFRVEKMKHPQKAKEKDLSQIVNDANRFAIETMKDPAYPLRLLAKVITVSLKTIKIVDELREIEFS